MFFSCRVVFNTKICPCMHWFKVGLYIILQKYNYQTLGPSVVEYIPTSVTHEVAYPYLIPEILSAFNRKPQQLMSSRSRMHPWKQMKTNPMRLLMNLIWKTSSLLQHLLLLRDRVERMTACMMSAQDYTQCNIDTMVLWSGPTVRRCKLGLMMNLKTRCTLTIPALLLQGQSGLT